MRKTIKQQQKPFFADEFEAQIIGEIFHVHGRVQYC